MDRLRALSVFKAVADNGSFVAAASALDISCPAASRMVQDLEQLLGVRLLHRTTRRLALTSVGEDVLKRACSLLQSYDELASIGRLSASEPLGAVRMAAPASFGRHYLGSVLTDFRTRYPGVHVQLHLCEGPMSLILDEVDLAVCLPEDVRPTHIARPLTPAEVGVYAAPRYLARRGEPARPTQLLEHDCLTLTTTRACTTWSFQSRSTGEPCHVAINGAMHANHVDVLADAAIDGGGIVSLPAFVARTPVGYGQLRQILADWRVAPLAPHITYQSRRNQPMSVRKLIQHLVETLSDARELHPAPLHLESRKTCRPLSTSPTSEAVALA